MAQKKSSAAENKAEDQVTLELEDEVTEEETEITLIDEKHHDLKKDFMRAAEAAWIHNMTREEFVEIVERVFNACMPEDEQ